MECDLKRPVFAWPNAGAVALTAAVLSAGLVLLYRQMKCASMPVGKRSLQSPPLGQPFAADLDSTADPINSVNLRVVGK